MNITSLDIRLSDFGSGDVDPRKRCSPRGSAVHRPETTRLPNRLMLSRGAAPPSDRATRSVAHERGGSAAGPTNAATSAPATS